MKIRYDGPSPFVRVHPFGRHYQGETKEYPDDFGGQLLASCNRQQFAAADGENSPDPIDALIANPIDDWFDLTVEQLRMVCDRLNLKYTKAYREAGLVKLIDAHFAEQANSDSGEE